ncbi:MAG: hypothetical protein PVF70_08595 [Anaerolineales bacterium]
MYSLYDLHLEKQYQAGQLARMLKNRHLMASMKRTSAVDRMLIKLGTLMINWGTRLQSRCQELADTTSSLRHDASHA